MLVIYDRRDLTTLGSYMFTLATDVHSLLACSGRLLVVSTGTDEVVELALDGATVTGERVHWRPNDPASGRDTVHLNSLGASRGEVFVSGFGPTTDRGWVGSTSGFVRALSGGPPIADQLRQPHSLLAAGDELLLLESGAGKMRGTRGQLEHQIGPGYLRGLCHLGDDLLVGRSSQRHDPGSGSPTCALLRVCAQTGHVIAEVDLGDIALEVYDLLVLERV
jgi:hypothetical protein